MNDLLHYFDKYNLTPRTEQASILSKIQDNWDKYKYFYIDAPVGIGKTHIALSIGESVKNSYFVTSSKLLQDQYAKTSPSIVDLKGRGNYSCNIDSFFKADVAPCLGDPVLKKSCINNKACDYYNQKAKALASSMMITNYPYFLYSIQGNKNSEDSQWKVREAVIMDEAHELESYLINMGESKLVFAELYEYYGIGNDSWIPSKKYDQNIEMIREIYDQLEFKINGIKEELEELFNGSKNKNRIKKLSNKLTKLENIFLPIKIFLDNINDSDWLITPNFDDNSITISPLSTRLLFHHFLNNIGEKFIFMSASLDPPEVFAEEMNIPLSSICVIREDSPFPPEKSPIEPIPICKMNYKEIDKNLETIVDAVDIILSNHFDQKGIIHSGNYKLTKAIFSNISTENKDRLILRDMYEEQSISNDRLMDMHIQDNKPTVLLSPSMTTGIDLYDDLSRFQIIVKLPFLSLADPRIKEKAKRNKLWYRSKMWIQILQSSGRSIRSMTDFADTYILDESFAYFYSLDKSNLPNWFNRRIK